MTNYAGNSDKSKKQKAEKEVQKKEIEKVIETDVIKRKKPLSKRMKETFFGGEAQGVMQYLAADVLLPAFRNLLVDTITRGTERMVFGEDSRSYSRGPRSYAGHTQYNTTRRRERSPFDPREDVRLPRQAPRPLPARQQDMEIILHSREDAERVVEGMVEILDMYDAVSVADLNEMVGLPSAHVDNKWGWQDLRGIGVRQIREGYLVELPPVESL